MKRQAEEKILFAFSGKKPCCYHFLKKIKCCRKLKGDNGFNTYGVCDVPAVEERYIIDMPLWDGRFS